MRVLRGLQLCRPDAEIELRLRMYVGARQNLERFHVCLVQALDEAGSLEPDVKLEPVVQEEKSRDRPTFGQLDSHVRSLHDLW